VKILKNSPPLGTNKESSSGLADILLEIVEQIEKWLSIQAVIGLSHPFVVQDDIRTVYDHTYEMTHLKFIIYCGKVFQEKDFTAYLGMIKPLQDETFLESLIQCVRLGQIEKMKLLLKLSME
jgi:hypothetical protein